MGEGIVRGFDGLINLNEAIGYFEKGALINSNSSPICCNLGNIYAELGNKNLAIKNYLRAIEIDPKNFNANYNLGSYYFKIEDIQNAEKYLNLAVLNLVHIEWYSRSKDPTFLNK